MRIVQALIVIGVLILSSSVLAHTRLNSSTPEDGAKLVSSPQAVEFVFSGDVRLAKLSIEQLNGKMVEIDFIPSATAMTGYTIPLPTLTPGYYKATWTAIGADTHKVEGTISFTLSGEEK